MFFEKSEVDNFLFKEVEVRKKIILKEGLSTLLNVHGGKSYNKGLFRIYSKSIAEYWTEKVVEYFPIYKDKICAIGYDWMGRVFAFDVENESFSYMFDPSTGEDFELEQTISGFFEEDLGEYIFDTLAIDDFEECLENLDITSVGTNECIGFKKFLFLGGEDELENMEIIDVEVYWDLNKQIFNKL